MRPFSLKSTLILAAVAPFVAVLVPSILLLGRSAVEDVRSRTIEAVVRARSVFETQVAAEGKALMMHAKEAARGPGLAEALAQRDSVALADIARDIEAEFGEPAVMADAWGRSLIGPAPSEALMASVRRGETPIAPDSSRGSLRLISLAPVHGADGKLVGAAGVYRPFDDGAARLFASLTRAQVSFVLADGTVAASTDPEIDASVSQRAIQDAAQPARIDFEGETYVAAVQPLGSVGRAVFILSLDAASAPVRRAWRTLGGGLLVALGGVLVLAWIVTSWAVRPTEELASAAAALAAGDFRRPVPEPRVAELRRLADAFVGMREALSQRIGELADVNKELAEKERRLREVQADLIQREKLAATGRIIAQLSHEINNPIANVRNCLQVLERRGATDKRNRSFLVMTIQEIERLARLTRQVLDLNRPRVEETTADAVEIVRAPLQLESHRLAECAIETRCLSDDDVPAVAIGPDALKQVLLNLVRNAADAMADGGSLTLQVMRVNGVVRLIVADNGPGVPADVVPRIFDPFFTTKSKTRGMGLGLFVAEEIVRSHGGRIEVERGSPSGATFIVDIPAVTAADPVASTMPGEGRE